MRTLSNPLAFISANVEATTGGLFHDPSVGMASRVFPRFHPGSNAANAADAVIGVKGPAQFDVGAAEATATQRATRFDKPDRIMKERIRRADEVSEKRQQQLLNLWIAFCANLAIWLFLSSTCTG
jgi:hypothetical protein